MPPCLQALTDGDDDDDLIGESGGYLILLIVLDDGDDDDFDVDDDDEKQDDDERGDGLIDEDDDGADDLWPQSPLQPPSSRWSYYDDYDLLGGQNDHDGGSWLLLPLLLRHYLMLDTEIVDVEI